MKLWKLGWLDSFNRAMDYDCAWEFVVRAPTEKDAREIASEDAGDEGVAIWLDNGRTTCVRLLPGGKAGVVVRDFHAG